MERGTMTTTYELVEYADRPLKFVRRIVDGVESAIPIEPANSDYQAYLAWLENPEAALSTPNV